MKKRRYTAPFIRVIETETDQTLCAGSKENMIWEKMEVLITSKVISVQTKTEIFLMPTVPKVGVVLLIGKIGIKYKWTLSIFIFKWSFPVSCDRKGKYTDAGHLGISGAFSLSIGGQWLRKEWKESAIYLASPKFCQFIITRVRLKDVLIKAGNLCL